MSFITYIEDIKNGCNLMVESTNVITNMKKLKIGCIPFDLESKIQTIVDSAYELVIEIEKQSLKNLSEILPIKEEKEPKLFFPEIKIPDDSTQIVKNISTLLKKLVKQVIEYFENRNKQTSRSILIEKINEIEIVIKQIENEPKVELEIPEIYSFYAQNFREHSEVILTQLNILVVMFPLNY